MADSVPRQGARDGEAATEGGSRPDEHRGKPRIRADKQRTARSVRLSEPEYLRIAAGAKAVGMSVAGFLAHSGLAAARDQHRTAAAIATEQDVLTALFALRRQLGHANNNLNQATRALHLGLAPEDLDATIAAVHRAADGVRQVTARMTNPDEGTQAA
ncbi:plasmid mobilization relaxosome protein MobC [Streptomyces sp. H34-S4]|nr:plasmid mobilization relaxosome protein MobC [Streptomyces sp. H34-S4]